MADIVPNVVVSMPSQLFTLARSFKAAANGRIYIGKIDTDPTIPENQIQVYLENEDGSHVPMAQPIMINAGGYPVYGGQIAKFVTVQGHSMAVYDGFGVQQFYFPNVLKYDPDQLRADLAGPNGATLVGYGTSTVAATLDTLKSEIENIGFLGGIYTTPEQHGAVGDGQADDSDAIIAAVNTGKNVIGGLGKTYKVTKTLLTNYFSYKRLLDFTGSKIIATHNKGIFVTSNTSVPTNDPLGLYNTVLKGVDVKGVVTRDSAYAGNEQSRVAALYNSGVINCRMVGFTDAIAMYDDSFWIDSYADDVRDNILASYGERIFATGIYGGSCAGDFLLVKSRYSYFGNGSVINAGLFGPSPAEGPNVRGGSVIAIGQDGAGNTHHNTIENIVAVNHGVGGVVFNGSYNFVSNVHCGRFSDADRTHVETTAPIVYMTGRGNRANNITADYYRDGIEIHDHSFDCSVTKVELISQSPYGTFSLTSSGTDMSNNFVDDIRITNPAPKYDIVFIGSATLRIGSVIVSNIKTAFTSGLYPIRLIIADSIRYFEASSTGNVSNNATLIYQQNNITAGTIKTLNHTHVGIAWDTAVTQLPDSVVISQSSNAIDYACRLLGTGTRFGGSMRITGPRTPNIGGGSLSLSSYIGPVWQGATGSVINYPNLDPHGI